MDFNPANEDNLEIGTYTITITGKPGTKYAGEKFKTTFQIVDVKLQDAVLFDNNTGHRQACLECQTARTSTSTSTD